MATFLKYGPADSYNAIIGVRKQRGTGVECLTLGHFHLLIYASPAEIIHLLTVVICYMAAYNSLPPVKTNLMQDGKF